MPVEIIESKWLDAAHTKASATVSGRVLDYFYPIAQDKVHYIIWNAHVAGTLTGRLEPSEYVAPVGPTLDEVKAEKITAIDVRTQELIRSGFTWGGNQFSMSDAAQRNWIGMGTMQSLGMMQYPFPMSTVNEGVAYLQSASDLMTFLIAYATYQTHPSGPLGSGRALKALVTACDTVDEVNAITDSR